MENGVRPGNTLPDPTADLHWSDYQGAIHDRFADNARKYPDRLCIVETASRTAPQREFTYQQIHEASNVIAHYFLHHGIERGDVIMIYAYRGVDLCIAILAVLKAGATFSVVDPAYPPDRQTVYLDVARPKGLIVIEKASKEEGRLSNEVRGWIKENLELRAEVPGLELLDDGTVTGGSLGHEDEDVLLHQQSLKSKHPGVVVGPDSTPTLSFTSGSEGRPKGVQGRHFSLTHYYPWMAETFNLSDKDRFTMLSGIAHDPIQRDVFTPLFLGATLLVPAKEDIQHQGLALWMRTFKPTVTHLTPAMGQILVGGASAEFPSLRNAFFVGDQLIKRDCRLLQALAPKCRIINMFGTTETQRAVSYYALPPRNEDPKYLGQMPDVIPAGRGMKNVQLLVVDRASLEQSKPRLCGIGEQGEIFVRAGGLAEGYLGSDDLSSEKFIPNFFLKNPSTWQEDEKRSLDSAGQEEPWLNFWKGPRDRLYRSGDLGRYTESGDVECTGRADNQIKIRGFRIELGEIDTYISQHPLVRENVTLVRRDKDEEPRLVSYVVPDMKEWTSWLEKKGQSDDTEDDTMVGMLKRFRLLREDVRARLKTKLASYAVPSIIIPLRKLPLTPNYKVDKKILPYPDAAALATAATAGRAARSHWTDIQKTVCQIWASRIGVPAETIGLDDGFIDVGGHSLRAQEVLFDIKRWATISISMNTLFQNPTLRDFSSVIAAALEARDNGESKADSTPPEMDYALDGEVLRAKNLPPSFPTGVVSQDTILVTGGTGFVGVSILENILNRNDETRVIVLVRARSSSEALARVKNACIAYGSWCDQWESRLKCIPGDLSKENLGLSPDVWYMLENAVDIIIHNGARVHWIYTYTTLRATNVLSTLACLALCSSGRPKHLTFISSTAVLDTDHYASLTTPILESDNLDGSRTGLSTGYAQSKYVSEYLMRKAGHRGLRGSIIRPGYITGKPSTGIGPTDDFLLRMLKGSIQLSCRPDLGRNTINLVPVDYCANIVVASSLNPPLQQGVGVVHVTPSPQLGFNAFLETLEKCGYKAPMVPYSEWRSALEQYVSSESQEQREPHALLPLFDWVTADLPSDTKSRNLENINAQTVLRANQIDEKDCQVGVSQETVGVYLAFMAEIGFIGWPKEAKEGMTAVLRIGEEQRQALNMPGTASIAVASLLFFSCFLHLFTIHPISSSPAQLPSLLLPNFLLIPAFAVIPIHSFPSSAYTFSPYPSSTAFPFIPQNLTSFTQPSSPNNFTTDGPYLEVVHEIYNLTTFPTGVAVDQDNRIFINFPRSALSNDVTLGLADSFNTTVAYPNASIQTCQRGQKVSTCFVNIQSVVIDSAQRIWALDTGVGPGQTDAVEYGAKIMSFNLTTNEMIDNCVLPYSISANGTSINDVRFNLSMSTAGVAFLTDEQGSLIIIDLDSHTYTRRLFNTSVVLADELFVGSFDGTPFYEWKGTQRSHVKIGSDGIAIANGNLYFAPLASRRLYQINQTTLANASLTDTEILNAVEFIGQTGSYLEGFTADDQGRVYMGTAEQNSLTYFNTSIPSLTNSTMLNGLNASSTNATNEGVIPASDIEVAPFVRSADIQWADSMCDQNGYLWFTTNQLPLQGTYQRNSITKASLPYKVYRTSVGGAGPAI